MHQNLKHRLTRSAVAIPLLALALGASACISQTGAVPGRGGQVLVKIGGAVDNAGHGVAHPGRVPTHVALVVDTSTTVVVGSATWSRAAVSVGTWSAIPGQAGAWQAQMAVPTNTCATVAGAPSYHGVVVNYSDGSTEVQSVAISGGLTCRYPHEPNG